MINTDKFKFHILIIAVLLLLTDCSKKVSTSEPKSDSYFLENGYSAATVFIPEGMAGCSWMLRLEKGNLEPLNLRDEFMKDGIKVWVKYHKEKNKVSACMMGDIVTIDEIEEKK
jgi:hypothetical protein